MRELDHMYCSAGKRGILHLVVIMTIYSILRKEMKSRNLLLPDAFLERFSASIGGHVHNLANLDSMPNPLFHDHGQPANSRNHLIYMGPSGTGKSVMFRNILRESDGILAGVKLFQSSIRSTFSVESWMGTKDKNKDGEMVDRGGVFNNHKRSIVGADDYQPMKLLFEGEGLGNDEIYLMTALDTDHATKDLSYGSIEVDGIGLTFWAGMRPTDITFKSGLGRRFLLQTWYPSRKDMEVLKALARSCHNTIPPSATPSQNMDQEVQRAYDDIVALGKLSVDYTEINQWLDTKDIPHFDEKLYRRAALGLSVAMGIYPDVPLCDEVHLLLEDEINTRMQLKDNCFGYMVGSILLDEDDYTMPLKELKRFLMVYYQMTHTEYKQVIARSQIGKFVTFKTIGGTKNIVLQPDRMIDGGI